MTETSSLGIYGGMTPQKTETKQNTRSLEINRGISTQEAMTDSEFPPTEGGNLDYPEYMGTPNLGNAIQTKPNIESAATETVAFDYPEYKGTS